MARPTSVRTGMFWRLGSELESRPVAVAAWWKVVCSRPSAVDQRQAARPGTCVFSLLSVRYSSRARGSGCFSASFSSTSASVDGPVLPFLNTGSPSSV